MKQKKKHECMGNPLAGGITHPIHYEWLNGIHPNTKKSNAYGSTHPCITKIYPREIEVEEPLM